MIYYIYTSNEQDFIKEVQEHLKEKQVTYLTFDTLAQLDITGASQLLVSGCVEEIKLILAIAHQVNIPIGIIPTPEQKELRRTFALPTKLDEAVALALTVTDRKIDLLYANGKVVLQEVVVGDAPPLDEFDSALKGKSFFDRIKMFWRTIRKVKELKHTRMKIKDANENEVKLSAIGVVGIKYKNATFASKLLTSQLNVDDGKLSIAILSPISILQYMGYLFKSLVSDITPSTLPKSVGYMRSSTISIEAQRPLKILVDSKSHSETPVELEVEKEALALNVGEAFWDGDKVNNNGKDSIKVDHLPSDEASGNYLSKAIPLFSHASQEQYASLFKNLREEGRISQDFTVLLVLAAMIATFGLFINSSSVIIGAMLLAPLMQPIVSLSMGVLRQDTSLEINGIRTIAFGVMLVLLTSAVIALFTPIDRLTSEMAGRLSPTILDLFVAIVSGMAAAYAKSNEKILGSLAGVAIAVALVPPIAVAGIGLGWGDWHMFSMAFLLFTTNLVGIVLAAALTFVLLGFSPLHIAKKGIFIWTIIVAVVAVPLYSSFGKMRTDITIQKKLMNTTFTLKEDKVKLTDVELLHRPTKYVIRCEVVASNVLSKEDKVLLKQEILKTINKDAEVIVTFRFRL